MWRTRLFARVAWSLMARVPCWEKKHGGGGNGESKRGTIGYEFYKTVFTDPQGTILASRGGLSFVKDVASILAALESTPVATESSSWNAASPSDDTPSSNNNNVVHHHKYLTSSQLLHLQLKDSQLRIHFLTQLLIILSYLASSPTVSLPTGIQSTPGSDTSKLAAQIKTTQWKQLAQIQKRTMLLLREQQPKGEGMWRCLAWVLNEGEGEYMEGVEEE